MHNFGSGADFEVLDLAGVAQETDVVFGATKNVTLQETSRHKKEEGVPGPGI